MTPTVENSNETSTPGVSRRTLVRSAAWSLPVIAIAVGAPAASASGDSAASLVFDNGNFSNQGKHFNAELRYPYLSSKNTLFMTKVTFTLLLPKTAFTGVFTLVSGADWSAPAAVSSGQFWKIVFTSNHDLYQEAKTNTHPSQTNVTSILVATFITIPNTAGQGAPSGTIVNGSAIGLVSDGTTATVAKRMDWY